MLVLTRKPEQTLCIGDDIFITVLEVRGDQVRLGIRAPGGVKVHREEVVARILEEGERGSSSGTKTSDGAEGARG